MKGHVPDRVEVKPVDHQSSFESLNSEVIYFLLCTIFCAESISLLSYGRLAEYSVSHMIYTLDLQQYNTK